MCVVLCCAVVFFFGGGGGSFNRPVLLLSFLPFSAPHAARGFALFCLLPLRRKTVVYSEGTLYLDDCDFRESSAYALVYSESNSTTVVRNAILGDKNCE